ncbi:MAG: outer membrane lipoprotein carrier protein LolA [Kiritimatiellae bacterium]|nr:outer membrane lipoprotein carrier protein LolA [Kiritimatiellia bacterium]
MGTLRRFLPVVLLLAWAGNLAAGEVPPRLREHLASIRTVESAFTQVKHLRLFTREVVLTGRLSVDTSAEKLEWKVETPVRYTVSFERAKMTQWDEATGKTVRFDASSNPALKAALGQMLAWFSGRFNEMEREYGLEVEEKADAVTVVCVPKGAVAAFLRRVVVTFPPDTGYIRSVRLDEVSGDWSEIRFENPDVRTGK